jgi:predicted amidohydrolase
MNEISPPEALQVSCVQMHWARPLEYNLDRIRYYLEAAAGEGSRVVLFPETSLTGYYFPDILRLDPARIEAALEATREAVAAAGVWAIVGSLRQTHDRFLNLAHVINPHGAIVHEYAKVHLAGRDEHRHCRPGEKLSLFEIDGIPCTLGICRDGRHPEIYRLPAMAGAQIFFQPSCSSDEVEAVAWKRVSGRAQLPAGPTTSIFHCVANTIGETPDGKQTSSGQSFIREPNGLPLAEAGRHQEEMITAVLDLGRADRRYALDSLNDPPFLRPYWEQMIAEVRQHADDPAR